jgi:hypothetical protein
MKIFTSTLILAMLMVVPSFAQQNRNRNNPCATAPTADGSLQLLTVTGSDRSMEMEFEYIVEFRNVNPSCNFQVLSIRIGSVTLRDIALIGEPNYKVARGKYTTRRSPNSSGNEVYATVRTKNGTKTSANRVKLDLIIPRN